jgi:hypothetical protein
MALARHEGSFRANVDEPLSLQDLAAVLGTADEDAATSREDAIACALSASDGWEEAVKRLGGAFAEDAAGLKERKGE